MSLSPESPLESTATLLALARDGDDSARERLIARYLPVLQRWARGRLPRYARDARDTDDLVQVTLMRALGQLDRFEPRREGAFLAYLRTILLNALRDEIRSAAGRPRRRELDELPDPRPSAVEEAIGQQRLAAYERGLATLPERQQEAVILRFELGFSYRQLAEALQCPSANAARMMVSRAVLQLADAIDV